MLAKFHLDYIPSTPREAAESLLVLFPQLKPTLLACDTLHEFLELEAAHYQVWMEENWYLGSPDHAGIVRFLRERDFLSADKQTRRILLELWMRFRA